MRVADSFFSIHSHGLVRIAAATPRATVGDVGANAAAIEDLARQAAAAGADLVLFPELCLSSYAIDDLHMQEALLDRVEQEIARLIAASA
ncbi:nitrilase-related carbon-nitrogen hydrolase, partial [Sphingobium sp.]|uniref:nitrilase-related carbon-nitrogen hydrolase n=1 Tax=Sphingobium sp. TaxID=1912891 RepID=UPI002B5B31C0